MNRKTFLKTLGIAGVGASLPFSAKAAKNNKFGNPPGGCVLIPAETPGPFPLDLTENTFFFRQDVREEEEGVQLNLRMKIIGLENCLPMENLRVNIWHCNKDGYYSGYNGNNNPNQEGLTYLRGYQITNASGEVEFITILPGWYPGRICHIHFQVFVNSMYSAVSQLTFDIDTKNAIYLDYPDLYTKGEDPKTFDTDNIFADGHAFQLATLDENPDTGGYSSFLEVTVEGNGVATSLGHIEKETAKAFDLGQNFPNPFRSQTSIPVTVKQPGHYVLSLWDLSGKRLANVIDQKLTPGAYVFEVPFSALGLSAKSLVYQLEAITTDGTFRMPKMMTAAK
ncbi:MAG: hypothetical protein GYB31_00680 [Bacteroidetes bacterium]|nr:hypothetical protein [Bacteroidota bacterium]